LSIRRLLIRGLQITLQPTSREMPGSIKDSHFDPDPSITDPWAPDHNLYHAGATAGAQAGPTPKSGSIRNAEASSLNAGLNAKASFLSGCPNAGASAQNCTQRQQR
jgi:hypothetical protein